MMQLLKQICICTLILILCAGQAAAFDLQIGHLNFGPPPVDTTGRYQADNNGFGAMISVPLGFSESGIPADTLNGQDLSQFTEQDAKDSAVVIMLVVVGIAVGAIAVAGTAD
jgi:hypothetical protein